MKNKKPNKLPRSNFNFFFISNLKNETNISFKHIYMQMLLKDFIKMNNIIIFIHLFNEM